MMVALGARRVGHYMLISAHRRAPASILSPFMYSQLVWAGALGYLVFADVPNRWTLTGASIVIASGLYLLLRERRTQPPVAPEQARLTKSRRPA